MKASVTFEHEQVNDIYFVEQLCWQMLSDAVRDRKHPMRTLVIGTAKEDTANLRTVVLRRAELSARSLCFHTDIRSNKIEEIRASGRLSWLAYDPTRRSQIRLSGKTTIHHRDTLAECQWSQTQHSSRRCYLLDEAPGSELTRDVTKEDEWLSNFSYTMEESEAGFINFAVIKTKVDTMDWYYTHNRGNRRAQFTYKNDLLVSAVWLTP